MLDHLDLVHTCSAQPKQNVVTLLGKKRSEECSVAKYNFTYMYGQCFVWQIEIFIQTIFCLKFRRVLGEND